MNRIVTGFLLAFIFTPAVLPDTLTTGNRFGNFTFVRIEYESTGDYGEAWYNFEGRTWQRWETDYPEAEEKLLIRIQELTTIEVSTEPISIRLTDPKIFDSPFIYTSDVGWPS